MLMPSALNTFIRVPMSRHGIVRPNGGWGLHEKARHITEQEKYDNKTSGFPGNWASEAPVFLLEDARKHVMSHMTHLRFLFFTRTLVTEISVWSRTWTLTFQISIKVPGIVWFGFCNRSRISVVIDVVALLKGKEVTERSGAVIGTAGRSSG